ncbi:MAG: hypothetical protein LUG94_01595 [Ruminococcus sp.]|nr:hypothetical protein [Ruminococcus sp.]
MMNNNAQKEVALKSIQRALLHKHNFIEDLENLIARTNDEYYKSKHEKMLKIVKSIFSGEDKELHHQLIEWCNSKNIDYEKYGVASKR